MQSAVPRTAHADCLGAGARTACICACELWPAAFAAAGLASPQRAVIPNGCTRAVGSAQRLQRHPCTRGLFAALCGGVPPARILRDGYRASRCDGPTAPCCAIASLSVNLRCGPPQASSEALRSSSGTPMRASRRRSPHLWARAHSDSDRMTGLSHVASAAPLCRTLRRSFVADVLSATDMQHAAHAGGLIPPAFERRRASESSDSGSDGAARRPG